MTPIDISAAQTVLRFGEAALRISGVVSGDRDPKRRLLPLMGVAAGIVADKNDGGGRNRLARIEGGFQRQPEPGEVGRVDLHDPDVNRMTGLEQLRRYLDRNVAAGRNTAGSRGVVVDRQRLKSALCPRD